MTIGQQFVQLATSILLLLLVLEGFALMLRGVGVRVSPIRWAGRTTVNLGSRLLAGLLQRAVRLLRWVLVQIGRGIRAAFRWWWANRHAHPVVFAIGFTVIIISVLAAGLLITFWTQIY